MLIWVIYLVAIFVLLYSIHKTFQPPYPFGWFIVSVVAFLVTTQMGTISQLVSPT